MTKSDIVITGWIVVSALMLLIAAVHACTPDADLINAQTKERMETP